MIGSIAERVADHVAALPERSFVAVRDVDGSRTAVDAAFSRLAAAGDVLRIRKGLYWKGTPTTSGVSPPRVEEVALALGGPGSGPAGIAAARWLGLTSQVPSTYLTAVPARAPAPFPGIRFSQRPVERLLDSLTPSEVAVLEVLRMGPAVVENDWQDLPELIARLAAEGTVRLPILDRAIAEEPHREARSRWAEIRHTLQVPSTIPRREHSQNGPLAAPPTALPAITAEVGVPVAERALTEALDEFAPGILAPGPGRSLIHMREVELGTGRPDAVLVVVSPAGLEARREKGLRLPSLAHARVLESIRTGAPSGYSRRYSIQLMKSLHEIGWLTRRNQVRTPTSLVASSLVVEAKISNWRRGIGQLAKARWASHDGALLMPMENQHRVSRAALRHNRLGLLVARPDIVEWQVRSKPVELRWMADLWLAELAIRSLETGQD
ncbi:MAG: hypothetical protein OXG69_02290 [bacterium]|nr:hypothetical protein [bacterium]